MKIDYNGVSLQRLASLGVVIGANNGVSISAVTPGFVTLGQSFGQPGNPANLLNNREIPLNGFSLNISHTGSALGVNFSLIGDAAKLANAPYITTQTSGFAENGRINFAGTDMYIGRIAGQNNTVVGGGNNTGVGQNALQNLTTATQNTAVGSLALAGITNTAFGNTAVGFQALKVIVTASGNTALGNSALQSLTLGNGGNTAVGSAAMSTLTTGTNNVSVGIGAGNALTITNNSVALGQNALNNSAVVGDGNIAIGALCLNQNIAIGANNIAIGLGINNTGGTALGANNIAIGALILMGGTLTNSAIIYPGGTGANVLTLSNVFVLGNNTQNILVGQASAAFADNGNRLQVSGKLNTGGAAPLTLGASAMDFGKIVTAASVLNATKYWEISVDGALVKVCIN